VLLRYDYIATSDDVHVHESFGGAGVSPNERLCYPYQWFGKMLLLGRYTWRMSIVLTVLNLSYPPPQSSKNARFDRKLARESIALLRECLPIRLRVIHMCLPSRHPPFNFLLPVIKFLLGKSLRRRLVVHHGCDLEILLSLESHGIIRANVPSVLGGHYNLQAELSEWLVDHVELEGRREANA
jgi:hypothetical protein